MTSPHTLSISSIWIFYKHFLSENLFFPFSCVWFFTKDKSIPLMSTSIHWCRSLKMIFQAPERIKLAIWRSESRAISLFSTETHSFLRILASLRKLNSFHESTFVYFSGLRWGKFVEKEALNSFFYSFNRQVPWVTIALQN